MATPKNQSNISIVSTFSGNDVWSKSVQQVQFNVDRSTAPVVQRRTAHYVQPTNVVNLDPITPNRSGTAGDMVIAAGTEKGGGLPWQGMLQSTSQGLGSVSSNMRSNPEQLIAAWPQATDPIDPYVRMLIAGQNPTQLILGGPCSVHQYGKPRWHTVQQWIDDLLQKHRREDDTVVLLAGEQINWAALSLTGTNPVGTPSDMLRDPRHAWSLVESDGVHGMVETLTSSTAPTAYETFTLGGSVLGGKAVTVLQSAQPLSNYGNAFWRAQLSGSSAMTLVALARTPHTLSGTTRAIRGIAGCFDYESGQFTGSTGIDTASQFAIGYAPGSKTIRSLWTIEGGTPAALPLASSDLGSHPTLIAQSFNRFGSASGSVVPVLTVVGNNGAPPNKAMTTTLTEVGNLAGPFNASSVYCHGGVHRLDQTLENQGMEAALDFSLIINKAISKKKLSELYDRVMFQSVVQAVGSLDARGSALKYGMLSGSSQSGVLRGDQLVPGFTGLGWSNTGTSAAESVSWTQGSTVFPREGMALGWVPSGTAFSVHCWVNRASLSNWETGTADANLPNAWPILSGFEGNITNWSGSAASGPYNWALTHDTSSVANALYPARGWVSTVGGVELIDWADQFTSVIPPQSADQWFHIAAVYSVAGVNATLNLYRDGALEDTSTVALLSPIFGFTGSEMGWGGGADWTTGTVAETSFGSWRGHLSALSYHAGTALTAAQITAIYNTGATIYQGA